MECVLVIERKESQGGGNREPQSVVCLRDLEGVRSTHRGEEGGRVQAKGRWDGPVGG